MDRAADVLTEGSVGTVVVATAADPIHLLVTELVVAERACGPDAADYTKILIFSLGIYITLLF